MLLVLVIGLAWRKEKEVCFCMRMRVMCVLSRYVLVLCRVFENAES